MSKNTPSEAWSNFLSYLKFFAFLAVVGAATYYYFKVRPTNTPVAEEQQTADDEAVSSPTVPVVKSQARASDLLRPIMTAELPKILAPLADGPYELGAEFLTLEKTLRESALKDGLKPSAWGSAQKLLLEIKRIGSERNAALETLKQDEFLLESAAKKNVSPNELRELQTRKEFFLKNKQKSWDANLPQMRRTLQYHYEQILAHEKNKL